jgi:hypothetical protein
VRIRERRKANVKDMVSGRASHIITGIFNIEGAPFSFSGREYLLPAIDGSFRSVLFRTARQVEKCCGASEEVLLESGDTRRVIDLKMGDRVVSVDDSFQSVVGTFVDREFAGSRPLYRIRTRQGHEHTVTGEHRLRQLYNWTSAKKLKVGDRIAVIRRGGEFGQGHVEDCDLILLAWMLAEGGTGPNQKSPRFTNRDPEVLQDFQKALEEFNPELNGEVKRGQDISPSSGVSGFPNPFRVFLASHGVCGLSGDKRIPRKVFHLNKKKTALFLNRLWGGDGSCLDGKGNKSLVYCSISKGLCQDVQRLLWKFGIPTSLSSWKPSLYAGTDKVAWRLRVETQAGVRTFAESIGAFGKGVQVPRRKEGNNRDTLPMELLSYIKSLPKHCPDGRTLLEHGLRRSPEYPLSRPKFAKYASLFPGDKFLQSLSSTDIFWDEIVSIDKLPSEDTYHIQVEPWHNFVSGGVVSHNSTTLSIQLVMSAALIPGYKTLYVSPTFPQTKEFSEEKVANLIDESDWLREYRRDKHCKRSILLKTMTNKSRLQFRYAFYTADRTRGLRADTLCYDQDVSVLTKEGWKKVYDITKEDLVADVNDDGWVEWSRPTRIIHKRHRGRMATFSHAGFHLRVTDDHNMWINRRVKSSEAYKTPDRWEFSKAMDLVEPRGMGFKMTCGAKWEDNTPEDMVIPGWPFRQKISNQKGWTGRYREGRVEDVRVPFLPFARLVGWFLSEGHIQWSRPKTGNPQPYAAINQNPGEDLEDIVKTVEACGLGYRVEPVRECRRVVLHSPVLGKYFLQFGKSRDKFIPREMFDSPRALRELLESLYRGDGCHHEGESWDLATLKTRSERLAYDVQEAWLRLGRPAVAHLRMREPFALNRPRKGPPLPPEPMYEVCAYKRDYMIFWKSEIQKKSRVVVDEADETVYCFTVKHHRPIVKGNSSSKPVICGNCVDEIQDILPDNIPIAEQCQGHSTRPVGVPDWAENYYKRRIYAGTPKTHNNTIEHYWAQSTQGIWMIRCPSCGDWNGPLGEKNIGKHGPCCQKSKCKRPVDPRTGMWLHQEPEKEFLGLHIPRLMVPLEEYGGWVNWQKDVLDYYEHYSKVQFYNEVLGYPCDNAAMALSEADLQGCCEKVKKNPWYRLSKFGQENHVRASRMFAGVDWGEARPSRTVLTIGGYYNNHYIPIFVKRYEPHEHDDPLGIVDDIKKWCHQFKVIALGVDAGHGYGLNAELAKTFGWDRIMQFSYVGSGPRLKYNRGTHKFSVNRTEVMSELFTDIRKQRVKLPCWEDFKPYAPDFTCIFVDYSPTLRTMMYSHNPGSPDDCFHSMLYSRMCAQFVGGHNVLLT